MGMSLPGGQQVSAAAWPVISRPAQRPRNCPLMHRWGLGPCTCSRGGPVSHWEWPWCNSFPAKFSPSPGFPSTVPYEVACQTTEEGGSPSWDTELGISGEASDLLQTAYCP